MPRQERVYFSIDRCLLRSYAEIMNKEKMITEPSHDQGCIFAGKLYDMSFLNTPILKYVFASKMFMVTFIIMLIAYTSIQAQTPITYDSITFRPNDVLCKVEISYVDAGQAGHNSIWHLGQLTGQCRDYTQSVVAKNDTIAVFERGGIRHYIVRGDTLYYKGFQERRSYLLLDQERAVVNFPFHFGDSIPTHYMGNGRGENLEVSMEGSGYTIADGTGVLTDGVDTLHNITRLHLYDDYTEDHEGQVRVHFRLHHYLWYGSGFRYPLMESVKRVTVNPQSIEEPLDSASYLYLPVRQQELTYDGENELIRSSLYIGKDDGQDVASHNSKLCSLHATLSADGGTHYALVSSIGR